MIPLPVGVQTRTYPGENNMTDALNATVATLVTTDQTVAALGKAVIAKAKAKPAAKPAIRTGSNSARDDVFSASSVPACRR